jgi:hypothetical protein
MKDENLKQPGGEILLYQTEDGESRIDVRLQGETVWLTMKQMTELFQRDKSLISRHIRNIFEEGELVPESTVANFATVQGAIKSIVVESDSYAIERVRYIHRNPLEAGLVDNLQKYEWSPHKIYLSDSKKYKWLHKDYILKLFSKSKPESIRLYEQFALKETPEEINQIFGRRNLPAVLGSKSFFDRTKDKFFNLMSMCEGVNSRNFI